MPGLEAFLLTWIDELYPITKLFPQGYSNKKNIAELLIITKSLIGCGKGTLQHKNKIYYYRTYSPSLSEEESTSRKGSSSSENYFPKFNPINKNVFLLILCDINYKKKHIDSLTKKIFKILDEGAFEKQDIKIESTRKINFFYEQYQNPETNSDKYIPLNEIMTSSDNNINYDNNNLIIDDKRENDLLAENLINTSINSVNNLKKRCNSSRIIWSKNTKTKTHMESIDINDLTSIKENESDLSIIFKQNLDDNFNYSQMKKMKYIKKLNIILCAILFVLGLVLIILLSIYA